MTKYLILVLFYENRACRLRSAWRDLVDFRGEKAIKELMLATIYFYIYQFQIRGFE